MEERFILSHPVSNPTNVDNVITHFNEHIQKLKKFSEINNVRIETRYFDSVEGLPKTLNIYIMSSHHIPREVEAHIYNQMELASDELRH